MLNATTKNTSCIDLITAESPSINRPKLLIFLSKDIKPV
jgi:hypothetical protein